MDKKVNPDFDVTMGAYDGAELCELLGLYILSQLSYIEGFNGGLYRDDCLSVSDKPVREIEHNMKKEISKIFGDCDLKVIFEPCSDSLCLLQGKLWSH